MKKHIYYFTFFCALSISLFSQRGKDGAGNIIAANFVVNIYTGLTADVAAGNTSISVASTAGYAVGDLVYIIQMQGARPNAGKDTIFPDFNSAVPTNTTYGAVTSYSNAGNHEFAQINSIPNGTTLILDCGLKNDYHMFGKVQVIRVPRYTTLTVTTPGYISSPLWNGTTGGIAVVEVMNNATLNAIPSFSVSGQGFRGGTAYNSAVLPFVGGGNKFGHVSYTEGGMKGESIAGDTTRYKIFSSVYCRGAMTNGGGGGDTHNSGGGGGANGGALVGYTGLGNPTAGFNAAWNLEAAGFAASTSPGGGRGGYTFSGNNQNPSTTAPGSVSWGGDSRRVMGGYGGRPLDYTLGKLFIGGGGGAGHANNQLGGGGGNGGGMVHVVCYGNISGAGTIVADGANGLNVVPSCADSDGAGGGGGGGTIILKAAGVINLTAATPLSAHGGNGGSVAQPGCGINSNVYGPGAGGGGGYIATTGAVPANNLAGGGNGTVSGAINNIVANFPPNGATKGGPGSTGAATINVLSSPSSPTICTNNSTTVSATATDPAVTINWYAAAAGGTAVATGTLYTTPTYTATGNYTVYAGSCGGSYRIPVVINVISGPTLTVNTPTICAGQAVTLTAAGATTYTWSTGPNTTTISVSPAVTTTYNVSGTISNCSASLTATVMVTPIPTITVSSPSICAGQTATLNASGATSYTWNPGAATGSTFAVSPAITSNYTITGVTGTCSSVVSNTVTVIPIPTVTASSATICTGGTATLTAGGATTYTWNPGAVTGTSFTAAPASTSFYTVTGTTGSCTASATGTITVSPGLTLTVNNPTICTGSTATLTVNGAANYTWSAGPTTSTLAVSPTVTTAYSVAGTSGLCSANQTATVTVNPLPTLTVNSPSLCAGLTTTLTASGAATYTWNPGAITGAAITVTPASSQGYTVTGTDAAGCIGSSVTNVTVVPNPTVSATSATVCTGQTATLIATGATSYTWSPGNVSGANYTITPVSNSTVSVIGSSSSCTSSATASVTVGTALSISINSPTICAGQTVTLTATSPATSYTWTPGGANTSTIVVTPGVTTSYSVDGSSGVCNGSGSTTVTVNSNPTVTTTGTTICSGQSATLTATGATTYTWLPSGTNGNTLAVTPPGTTNYTVTGTSLNCSTTATLSVTVTPTPTLTVNSPTICGGSATLTASGAASYTWAPGGSTSATLVVTPAGTSSYGLIGANGSCQSTATTAVVVSAAPLLNITSDVTSGCGGVCVSFSANPAGYNPVTFNFGDGSTPAAGLTTNCYSLTGAYSVTAMGTFSTGCTTAGINTIVITVNSTPVAGFSVTGTSPFTASTAVTFTNISSGSNNTYMWSYDDGTTSALVSQSHTYSNAGNYCVKLVATDAATLCRDSVTHCIEVTAPMSITIPNVFTPNNDGTNDVFKATGVGIPQFHCAIFDRWGLKMYEWDGINGSWDGKTKTGDVVPSGTYFYFINYTGVDGTAKQMNGDLTLYK